MGRYATNSPRPLPSCERLHELLVLDDDGTLRWRVNRRGSAGAGSVAGSVRKDGYRQIVVDGRTYLAHRIVWKMAAGVEPPVYIDHINGDPLNNCIDNLREATNGQNIVNVKSNRRSNTSGFRGVCWEKRAGKWQVQITVNGRRFSLGYYTDPSVAALAYDHAIRGGHGAFGTTNEALGYIPKGRALTPDQADAVDARLKRHGLIAEKEPACVLSECHP